MSIEHYAVFRAAPGSVADLAVKEITEARRAARAARNEFCNSIGAVGLWGNETHVDAVIFREDTPLPVGYRKKMSTTDGVVAVPDKKKKEGKELVFTLRALPSLPGAESFTKKIGGSMKIVGRYLRWCQFERAGDTLFVMTPFFPKESEDGNVDEESAADQIFTPAGCERVPLSVYYATKEAAEAAKNSAKETAA